MSVNIVKAFKNVLSDEDFLSKYTILVVLSFCSGLMAFAVLAKNNDLLLPSLILAVAAAIISFGYDIQYIKDLIKDENAKMPEWSNIGEYILCGTKCFGAILIFALAVIGIIISFTVLVALLASLFKPLILLIFIPLLFLFIIEIFTVLASVGFMYAFIESDMNLLSLFDFKKVCSYFSVNYFTVLFITGAFAIFNGILGSLTTINIKYSLLYIIPLMLAAFFRMGINNMIAQAYRANRDNEKGSATNMVIALGVCILLLLLFVVLSIFFKLVA